VVAEEGAPGFGDGQDVVPLEDDVADVVEEETVQGDSKTPTQEGTAVPDAQDAVEESVEASDALADTVPVADEEAGAWVAESAPVEHESAGLPDAQDDITESTVVAAPLEPLAEGVVAVEEQEKDTAIEGSQVVAEEGAPGFGDGQDAEPLEDAVADVVEEETVQGVSETVEEVVNDETGISELEQEAFPRDIEEAAVQDEALSEVLCESPDDKLQPTRLLEQYVCQISPPYHEDIGQDGITATWCQHFRRQSFYDCDMHKQHVTGELKNQTCGSQDKMAPRSPAERRHQDTSCTDKPQHG
jgi:hypothetical protein